jgi:putative ABC transport system ATP-binding protein
MNISQESFSKFPHEISGGEAQRVAVVRATINSPSILFADEPTGALNSDNTREVLDLLSELNQNGQTIVVVTHDIATALRGNRIFYISDGTIRNELRFERAPEGGDPDKDTKKAALDTFLQEMKW